MSRVALPAVLMRGGTSKGLFVREADLPPAGSGRDAAILALLGSPDRAQIDGLGGATSSTSKLIAVSPTSEPGCDVEYLFAQAAVDRAVVDYGGNCGNLTAAVGPYVLEEGLVSVDGSADVAALTLFNRNTAKRVRAHVPVKDGKPVEHGDFALAGVPGTGARIVTEFLDPGGSVLGAVLPTGRPVDKVEPAGGPALEVSLVDVGSPMAFVRAADVGTADVERLEAIRTACGRVVGLERSLALPRLAVVSPPGDRADADITAVMLSMQRIHHAFAGTGLMCLAAAARLPGTIPNEACRPDGARPVRIGHPKGVAEVGVVLGDDHVLSVAAVVVARTARRLMAGTAYYHERA